MRNDRRVRVACLIANYELIENVYNLVQFGSIHFMLTLPCASSLVHIPGRAKGVSDGDGMVLIHHDKQISISKMILLVRAA